MLKDGGPLALEEGELAHARSYSSALSSAT